MTVREHDTIRAIEWKNGRLSLLDQRHLPQRHEYLEFSDSDSVAQAITGMVVRGAPAIGITATYAVVLAARDRYQRSPATWKKDIEADLEVLEAARPTAVNLSWAVRRMRDCFAGINGDPGDVLLEIARSIHNEDIVANRHMGELGAALINDHSGVLTHCNAGSLATGGYGTALGVIRSAYVAGKLDAVYADETRPWLQGARLTAWELIEDRIPVILLADGAASYLMNQGRVQWVIVGADRIAANGDVANKIGTYGLAVAARHHGIHFMVVAPTSTLDMRTPSGKEIPIESRSPDEVLNLGAETVAAGGARAWNPAFDITPAGLIDVIVTEKGVVESPDREKLALLMAT